MSSFVWNRDIDEAYEHPAQEQFLREADDLLLRLYRLLNPESLRFVEEDRSPSKAVWLLFMDALDFLEEALHALKDGRHRVASSLFRTISEALDLAELFDSGDQSVKRLVKDWFNDKTIPNSAYRSYVKRQYGEVERQAMARRYSSLSRFVHRTYRAILPSYSRGGGGKLVHDRQLQRTLDDELSRRLLALPEVISSYMVALSVLILRFARELSDRGLASREAVWNAIEEAFENDTVPRQFIMTLRD